MTLKTFTLPAPTRKPGDASPSGDMDTAISALTALGCYATVLNTTVAAGGADPTGGADSTAAFTAAASGGGTVKVPQGTYLLNSGSAVALSVAGTWLVGDGEGATVLQIGGSLSAAEAIAITANWCGVRDLSIVGASSTVTSNPVANGVEITGAQHCKVRDVFFQYVNGYAIESVGGSSNANLDLMIRSVIVRNCAGGIHLKGVTGSSFGGEHFLTDIQMQQIGAASGGSANLDALFIEDVSDVQVENFNGSVSDVSTGSTLHIKGLCSTIQVTNFDLGVFPNASPNNSVLTIEDSSNGSPSGVHLTTGILQEALTGATVSGAASRIYFNDTDFANNATDNVLLSGTGSGLYFTNCTWRGGGSGGSGTNYDLHVTSSATGKVTGGRFLSPLTSSGTPGVQGVVHLNSAGQDIPFAGVDFKGSGVSPSLAMSGNQPSYIRDCKGYNPHGDATVNVAVPSSGAGTAALHYDAWFYITADATDGLTLVRNTNGQGGGAGPTLTIPAGATVAVFVIAQANFTPAYTAGHPPTWVVDGQ